MSLFFNLSLVCSVSFAFVFAAQSHEAPMVKTEKPQPILSESMYNLRSSWTSQDGKVFHLRDLQGKPVVVAMAYTSCQAACPVIIEDMRKISKGLSEKDRAQFSFLIFSFDSRLDTPAQLKAYAEKRKIDLTRWQLFHGEPGAVSELAKVLGVRYKKDPKTDDFDHSNVITLVDGKGLIRFQQNGLGENPKEFLTKVGELSKK